MNRAPGATCISPAPAAQPFLKWAGGKRQLLPAIRRFYPPEFTVYAEPFLGSGAVFFDLAARGHLHGVRVLLMDTNPDLVGCYRAIRDDVNEVVRQLQRLERGHRVGGARFYYDVRDGRYNPQRRASTPAAIAGDAVLAAMLIYLNRTCFNGLYRQNAQGDFNTPIGRYANPTICDEENLRRVSALLLVTRAELRVGDFSDVEAQAGPGAFVYLDPPYAPVSRTASFRSYTAGGFGDEQQQALQRTVVALARRGARVLLSNSVTPLTTRLYETAPAVRRAGIVAHRVPARRAINSDAAARGPVTEYLVSNISPADVPAEDQ